MPPVQIFMSYARHDDLAPPDLPKAKGFVAFLEQQLIYQLQLLGHPLPRIWRDIRNIEPADQFDPLILEGINASSLLVVVLSRNWPQRPYCVAELESFKTRWQAEGEVGIRKRIIVVSKHQIDPKERPSLLQGQQSYEFFVGEAGREMEFFVRGEVCDPGYYERLRELASYLWRASARMVTAPDKPMPVPRAIPLATRVSALANGRTVYLAKPAADMRKAYLRVIEELQGRGYAVVPDAAADIPNDADAVDFVDSALAKAEMSIHLLGEGEGYKPEGAEPIVKLQLARAAVRAGSTEEGGREAGNLGFQRIVWAPKVLEEAGAAQQKDARDPLKVLEKVERQLATDKVEGDNLGKFVEFLIQFLSSTAPAEEALEPIESEARVYVYHRPEDHGYAFSLAKALQELKVEPMLPALQGEAAQLNAIHRQNLMDCDAVVLCWAQASEAWAKATSRELKDWRLLGRTKKFDCRGLVAGPPSDERKSYFLRLPPKSEIDVALDLTGLGEPSPAALDPLVHRPQPKTP